MPDSDQRKNTNYITRKSAHGVADQIKTILTLTKIDLRKLDCRDTDEASRMSSEIQSTLLTAGKYALYEVTTLSYFVAVLMRKGI